MKKLSLPVLLMAALVTSPGAGAEDESDARGFEALTKQYAPVRKQAEKAGAPGRSKGKQGPSAVLLHGQSLRDEATPILLEIARLEDERAFEFLTQEFRKGPSILRPAVARAIVASEHPGAAKELFRDFSKGSLVVRLGVFEALRFAASIEPYRKDVLEAAPRVGTRDERLGLIPVLGRIRSLDSAKAVRRLVSEAHDDEEPDRELGDRAVAAFLALGGLADVKGWLSEEAFAANDLSKTELYVFLGIAGGLPIEDARKQAARLTRHPSEAIALAAQVATLLLGQGDAVHAVAMMLGKKKGYELLEYRSKLLDAIARPGSDRSVEILLRLGKSRDAAVRAVAMGSLARIPGKPKALEGILGGLGDAALNVRAAALRALEGLVRNRRQDRAMIPALIGHIEKERQHRLRVDALELLVGLTGVNMGFEVSDWKNWWEVEKDHFRFGGRERGKTLVRAHDMSYFGIEITSTRIAFLLDVSSSMLAPAKGKETSKKGLRKIDVLKRELGRVVAKLPNRVAINIFIFDRRIRTWKRELAELNPRTRAEAVQYVKGLTTGSGTNIFDTIELAFKDRHVDTIYLLTDGQASAGRFVTDGEILQGIQGLNRARGVALHCIAFGRECGWMRQAAAENGGQYRFVAE